jgi:hypothetical protein
LCGAIFVFAYSTIISWSYYGDRAIEYLVGPIGVWPYRIIFVLLVALGPFFSLGNVLAFSDISLLSMAFPNIIGMVILSGVVAAKTRDYVKRLRAGEMNCKRSLHPYLPGGLVWSGLISHAIGGEINGTPSERPGRFFGVARAAEAF